LEEGSEVVKNTKHYDYILNAVNIRVKRRLGNFRRMQLKEMVTFRD
jgi:hypothetical protein